MFFKRIIVLGLVFLLINDCFPYFCRFYPPFSNVKGGTWFAVCVALNLARARHVEARWVRGVAKFDLIYHPYLSFWFDIIFDYLLGAGNIRNLAMEKVASTVFFPCKYASNGCPALHLHPDKGEHEDKLCEFRPYVCPCPGAQCKWSGSLDGVVSIL